MSRGQGRRAALLLLGAALAGPSCGKGPTEAGPQAAAAAAPAPVVRTGPLEDRFMLTGELAATKSEVLRVPRTPTFMIGIKWIVDDGAQVKKGDRVVEFDTASLSGLLIEKRLAALRAEAELASDAAKSASGEMDKRAEVERKRVAREKARLEAEVPADLRPKREHQEKQLAVTREEDALRKAEEDLAALRRTARLDRRIKEIALARAARELREIEDRLDQLALRAPRDGLVQLSTNFRGEARKYQIGDSAYAGMDVATMPDLGVMHVKARLPDVDEGAIKPGMKAECVLDAHPGRRYQGVVESITPVARQEGRDAVRNVFDVIVKLDATDRETMLPGMSVRVEVVRRKTDRSLLLPRHALATKEGKTFARLRDGRQVPVEVEFCALEACALRSGPPEGTALSAPSTAAAAAGRAS